MRFSIPDVEPLQHQPAADRHGVADHALGFQVRQVPLVRHDLGTYRQRLSGANKTSEFHVPSLFEDHGRMSKVFGKVDQPSSCLQHRLQHQHPRHHRKTGKMILEILLRQRKCLDGPNARPRLKVGNSVNQRKLHGTCCQRHVGTVLAAEIDKGRKYTFPSWHRQPRIGGMANHCISYANNPVTWIYLVFPVTNPRPSSYLSFSDLPAKIHTHAKRDSRISWRGGRYSLLYQRDLR